MKSREWISTKTIAIVGIVFLLFVTGFHFYTQRDLRKFEATLPKVPATDVSISPVAFNPDPTDSSDPVGNRNTTEAAHSSEETPQNVAEAEPNAPKDENQLSACAMATMGMGHINGSEQSESAKSSKLYAGLTEEEVLQLWNELSSPYATNADEKYDLLEEVLLDRHGPDPRIPEYVKGLKKVNIIHQIALSRTNSEEDVDNYLSYSPAVFANDFVELSIDLFKFPPETAAVMRESAKQIAAEVDTLKLLQETRPMVQEAIDAGDLSPEEGELVIESVTGLKVKMPGEDRTASVGNSRISTEDFIIPQKVSSPESVHSNIPEYLGD